MGLKRIIGVIVIILCLLPILLVLKPVLKKETQFSLKTEDLKEASFWQALEDGKVQCQLCPNRCVLAEGQRGLCKARENRGGKLYSLVYGKPVTTHVDPIEKKPFYHFLPTARAYSLATTGCNLQCLYCQNWDIAQRFPEDVQSRDLSPEQVIEEALQSGAQVIAFTYNEPIVWYEYMYDIAKLAQEKGLRTVMVSNGYINPEPLKKLIPYMDAIKVDLKGFDDQYYQEVTRGRLEPVLGTLKVLRDSGIHYEIVTLLVTGKNDSEEEIKKECQWIKENLGDQVPLHFSRFSPKYKLANLPPTPEETIKKAREICLDIGLKYVYTGNIADVQGSTTFCPDNNQPLIIRKGYFISQNEIDQLGESSICPTEIPGVWR